MINKTCTKILTLTPKLATKYLKQNSFNRSVRQSRVDRYARLMSKNQWIENGDTIRFDVDGNCIDGQHRLLAVVKSGNTIPCVGIFNLPREAFSTIDQGLSRRAGDIFYCSGIENSNLAAAVSARLLMYLESGDENMAKILRRQSGSIEHTDILKCYHRHEEVIKKSMANTRDRTFSHLLYPSSSAFLYVVLALKAPEFANHVFLELIEGSQVRYYKNFRDNPLRTLKNKLIEESTRETKPEPHYKGALFIKAVNAYAKRKNMRRLEYRLDEQFPAFQWRSIEHWKPLRGDSVTKKFKN